MSVIIPAFNEERYIAETLDHLHRAEEFLKIHATAALQTMVVDNGSTDRTVAIARDRGVAVIHDPDRHIAKVRNAGATAADHDVLVFVDADTLVPAELLLRIGQTRADPHCVGGAVDAAPRPERPLLRVYLEVWRALGILAAMAQGACQFCRREVFAGLGGYDETVYMGEDVDFFGRMRAAAPRCALQTPVIPDLQYVKGAKDENTISYLLSVCYHLFLVRLHELQRTGKKRQPLNPDPFGTDRHRDRGLTAALILAIIRPY